MSPTLKAHIALFLVALIYGANYTIAKIVMDGGYLHPVSFILLRIATATTLFVLFHRLFIKEKIARKDYGRLALCGLFGVAINQLFFLMGLNWTSPINASLIMTTTPILVLIVSAILLGERITSLKVLGILVGAVGAGLLIAYGKKVSFDSQGLLGDLMIFINASSYGLYLVLARKLMKKYHPITVVKWVFIFGLLYVTPISSPYIVHTDWASFSLGIWLAVGYVLVFTTFFAYLFNAYALSVVSPSIVSIYIYLQPLLASLIAILWGVDVLTSVKLLAGTFIFVGVYLVSFAGRRRVVSKLD
ncbi:MAG: DMT family transporter [Bacteroidota bacterium]